MFVRQYICSHSVYTRSRKRRGCFSSTLRMRAVSMMSMPTSELTQGPTAEHRRGANAEWRRSERSDGWHGGGGCVRAVDRPRRRTVESNEAERAGRRGRTPDPGTGPVAPARKSLDSHGLRQVARLVDIVRRRADGPAEEAAERVARESRLSARRAGSRFALR